MENLNLSLEQKQALGIVDERIDYYFKVENTAIDGIEVTNPDTGEVEKIEAFNSIYEAHLYTVLSRYCNNNKVAFPSVSTLCRKCFCSKNTLLKAIKGLEEKGYIAKVKRFNKETKINETNIYAVKNICIPGSGDELGVVHHVNQGSSPREPKEEQVKKNNIKNKHVTCSNFKKSEKKIMLGLNPKGYPQKDEWEKFLNKNLIGIDYTPVIEKAIKKLLKTENERAVEKILLETYKTGLNENRSIAEIATIIGTGNALRAKAVKPKKEKAIEVPAEQKEKIEAVSSFDKEKEFIKKRELEKQEAENQKLPEVILTPELEKELLVKAEQDGISSAFLSKMKLRNSFMYESMLKKYI
ncbi:MAG: helix-turn-helix domain-containing protein [Cetobacterium sp.]